MEQIKTILKNIGLTDTEINIYLAGLTYPEIGVNELEKQTGIKRTTIYHAIDTMMQKGLVSKKGTPSRLMFTMSRPENIKRHLDKEITKLQDQQKDLEKIIPHLNQKIIQEKAGVKITQYEGLEGVKMVVDEALYCQSKNWDIISPAKNFFSEFEKKYADYYLETRGRRGIIARSLWEYRLPFRALSDEELKQRQPRYLPEVMHGKFKSVFIIFDDKVAIISSLKELSAILIESQEIHNSFCAMFEGLWAVSEDYEKVKGLIVE
jgi:HTH-type transcriptional regulator, sugar sensing transcriptional regulator